MSYIIKTSKGYVKRTSRFGEFYGSIVLTDDIAEALKFTRQKDAEERARTLESRTAPVIHPTLYPYPGRDYKKFGQLLAEVVEHS